MISIVFFALCLLRFSCQEIPEETKDVPYYLKLLKENIQKAENYVLPTDNRRFFGDVVPDDSEAKDFGEFDFIIVGAGSSGSVIFNRIAKRQDWKILLLEAGGEEDDFSDIPVMMLNTHLSEMNWGYKTTSQNASCFGMVDNQCFYPRGRVLGGSGTINALMYVRGNKNDYNRWEDAGNPTWSYKNVLPFFKKSEHAEIPGLDKDYHSTKGLLNVTLTKTAITEYFLKANEEMGSNYLDYNGRTQMGHSRIQFNINKGKRVSGGRAFIDPMRKRKNVKVVTNALATKVLIEDESACGLNFLKNGILYKATVRKEVIISAGAINTPQLLILSGIGPKKHLEELDIPIIKDLPVGKHLQDHPFFSLTFDTNYTSPKLTLEETIQEYIDGKGFYPYSVCEGIKFINTEDLKSKVPDIEYIFIPSQNISAITAKALNLRPDFAKSVNKNVDRERNFKLYVVLLHPKSLGEVKLKSKDPLDFPNINTNYFSDEKNEDIDAVYRGILHVLTMTDTESFRKINATFSMNFDDCDKYGTYSKEYWYCAIRHLATTLYHPIGTARMGTDPLDSVVNHELQVHGIENLRIADCSIIPSTTSGHTNAVAFMIGEKMADILKQTYEYE